MQNHALASVQRQVEVLDDFTGVQMAHRCLHGLAQHDGMAALEIIGFHRGRHPDADEAAIEVRGAAGTVGIPAEGLRVVTAGIGAQRRRVTVSARILVIFVRGDIAPALLGNTGRFGRIGHPGAQGGRGNGIPVLGQVDLFAGTRAQPIQHGRECGTTDPLFTQRCRSLCRYDIGILRVTVRAAALPVLVIAVVVVGVAVTVEAQALARLLQFLAPIRERLARLPVLGHFPLAAVLALHLRHLAGAAIVPLGHAPACHVHAQVELPVVPATGREPEPPLDTDGIRVAFVALPADELPVPLEPGIAPDDGIAGRRGRLDLGLAVGTALAHDLALGLQLSPHPQHLGVLCSPCRQRRQRITAGQPEAHTQGIEAVRHAGGIDPQPTVERERPQRIARIGGRGQFFAVQHGGLGRFLGKPAILPLLQRDLLCRRGQCTGGTGTLHHGRGQDITTDGPGRDGFFHGGGLAGVGSCGLCRAGGTFRSTHRLAGCTRALFTSTGSGDAGILAAGAVVRPAGRAGGLASVRTLNGFGLDVTG